MIEKNYGPDAPLFAHLVRCRLTSHAGFHGATTVKTAANEALTVVIKQTTPSHLNAAHIDSQLYLL